MTEEKILHAIDGGGILVVNLKNQSHLVRRILVEIFLGELTKILSSNWLRAAFLFAEEAHLYLRDTYWDDIITRMRHIGLFTTFITSHLLLPSLQYAAWSASFLLSTMWYTPGRPLK